MHLFKFLSKKGGWLFLKELEQHLKKKTKSKPKAVGIHEFIFGSLPIFFLIFSHFQFSLWPAFQLPKTTCDPQILKPIQTQPSNSSVPSNSNFPFPVPLIKMQILLVQQILSRGYEMIWLKIHMYISKVDRKPSRSVLHFKIRYCLNLSLVGRWYAGTSVTMWSVPVLPLVCPVLWHILPVERIGHVTLQTPFMCQT